MTIFFMDYEKFLKYNSLISVCKDKKITKIFRNILKYKKKKKFQATIAFII